MQVAIFGGTFDPPHVGHVAMCEWLVKRSNVDEVWVIPCLDHPFGKAISSFEDRYTMSLLAFQTLGKKILVQDVERKLGGISHTIRTVRHLISSFPSHQFQLVSGSDAKLEEWRDGDQLRKLLPLIIIPRGKGSPIPDVSSTDIRSCIAKGEPFAHLVPKSVAVYIVTHHLYR